MSGNEFQAAVRLDGKTSAAFLLWSYERLLYELSKVVPRHRIGILREVFDRGNSIEIVLSGYRDEDDL